MQVTLTDYLKDKSAAKPRRKHHYNKRYHVIFQYKRSMAICLSPEIVDKLGLQPGIYESWQELDGTKLIVTFRQKQGGFET